MGTWHARQGKDGRGRGRAGTRSQLRVGIGPTGGQSGDDGSLLATMLASPLGFPLLLPRWHAARERGGRGGGLVAAAAAAEVLFSSSQASDCAVVCHACSLLRVLIAPCRAYLAGVDQLPGSERPSRSHMRGMEGRWISRDAYFDQSVWARPLDWPGWVAADSPDGGVMYSLFFFVWYDSRLSVMNWPWLNEYMTRPKTTHYLARQATAHLLCNTGPTSR